MKKRLVALLLGIVLCFSVVIPAAAVDAEEIGTDLGPDTEFVFLIDTDGYVYVSAPSGAEAISEIGEIHVANGSFTSYESNMNTSYGYGNKSDDPVYDVKSLSLIALDPQVGEGYKGIVDSWPKKLQLSGEKTVAIGESLTVTAEVRNAMDKLNKGINAEYTWTVTPGSDVVGGEVQTETIPASTGGTSEWTVTLQNSGHYTIECSATAIFTLTNGDGSEVRLPLNLDENAKYTMTVEVTKMETPEPTTPTEENPGSTTTVPDNGDLSGVKTTIPISSDPAYANRPVEICFDGKTWYPATLNANGELELEGELLKEFVKNGGNLTLRSNAFGNYAELGETQISWAKKRLVNDGTKPPLKKENFIEETVKDGGGQLTGVDSSMEYSTDGGKTWKPCTENPQPINPAGVTVLVRYKAKDRKLPSSWVSGEIPSLENKILNVIAKNGYVNVNGKNLENGESIEIPEGDPVEIRLVGNIGYQPKSATIDNISSDLWHYEKKTGILTIEQFTENCTVTAKFTKPDSGSGDFIPVPSESTGTTGSQTATGVTGNVWGSLLGGTGGTTAQSGAQTVGGFSDVSKSAYYAEAVLWAVNNNITNGTSATTFSPDASCTRAQMVTFLWRQAGSPEPGTTNNPFTDVKADQYYYKAVLWAVGKGITNGTSATTFSPNATVTRAQCVTFLWRNAGKPNAGTGKTFTDVTVGPYSDAINWAAARGITQGTSATTFSPSNPCTRAQIVTFMYRAL